MALLRDKETKVIREVSERYVRRWPDDYEAPTKKDLAAAGVADSDIDSAWKAAKALVEAHKATPVETNQSAGGTEGADV